MQQAIEKVREFNRLYTKLLGLLEEKLLDSPVSLAEGRVLYEIQAGTGTARDLCAELHLDKGYLSRMLAGLERAGYVVKRQHARDARVKLLALSPRGRALLEEINRKAEEQVIRLLHGLSENETNRLLSAMATIEALLNKGGDVSRDAGA